MSKITQLGCCGSQQVTEMSTLILHLKLCLAFLSVFILMIYNNMTSFCRALYILPLPLVFLRAFQTVFSTNLKNFPEKSVFGSEKSCEGLSGSPQKSLSSCSLQIQQQAWQSEFIQIIDLFLTANRS